MLNWKLLLRRLLSGCILVVSANDFKQQVGSLGLICVFGFFVGFFFIAGLKPKSLTK
jgi:hypothetical protein